MKNSASVFCMFLLLAGNLFAQQATTTTWQGTLSVNGTALRLEVDVTTDGEKVRGDFRSIDQGNAKFALKDPKFDDTGLSFKIAQIGAQYSGKFNADNSKIEGTFKQSGMSFDLDFTKKSTKKSTMPTTTTADDSFKLKEAWIGELELGIMKPVMQFRIGVDGNGKPKAFFDSVTEGRTDFEANHEIKDGELRFSVKAIRLKFVGKLNEEGDQATGTWSQGGRNFDLTLKRQAEKLDKGENVWDKRPQKPVGPFPYDSIDVKFENSDADLTLAGTLTIPKGTQRHPAVILISGSGAQDRDETLMEHKPFLVLADYLSRNGIAVLRYDDRGTAESTGKFSGATTEDFATDAAAAVEFLSRHKRIDSQNIGLAGHSEGGLIAPITVGLRDDVAFVVLMAATGVPGTEISVSQVEAMLRGEGMPEDSIKIETATTKAIVETAAKYGKTEQFADKLSEAVEQVISTIPEEYREEGGKKIRDAISGQKQQLQSEWMQFFLSYDPRPALGKIECPVLAIVGSKDLQVLPDLNMPEIEKALKAGGNSDHEMVVLDGLNHLFQTADTGTMSEYVTIPETFNPKAMKIIGDWISEHTNVKN